MPCVLKDFCAQEFPIQESDIVYGNLLGAFHFAGVGIGAGAELFGIHLRNHGKSAMLAFRFSLGQFAEMCNFGCDKKHGRGILACRYAGAATDAGSRFE